MYQDSPPPSPSATPSISETFASKPLPAVPFGIRAVDDEGHREAALLVAHPPDSQRRPSRHRSLRANGYVGPYSDNPSPPQSNEDIPLAYLYPYPTEAPPAYHIAVRQSYGNTLFSHNMFPTRTSVEIDEEAGRELDQPDHVRYRVEKVLAALIVSGVLLIIMAVMIALIFMNGEF